MRPDIRLPRVLDARVRDYADRQGIDWRDAYVEVVEAGIDEVERRERAGLGSDDVREAAREFDSELREDEIEAVVAAWEFIREEHPVSPKDVREAVHGEFPAGKDNPDWWWQSLDEAIIAMPGIARESQRKIVWIGED